MSLPTLGSRSSLFPILERQALPNETLTSVLAEMDPWDAWPLRIVCKNFNSYILRILAPRFYVPDTYIYIRRPESWIFHVSTPNYYTPPTATGLTDPEAEGGAAPPVAPISHRGQKLQFSAFQPHDDHGVSHFVDYVPSRNEERPIIQDKLYEEVEVMFRVGPRYYRHVQLSSLSVDRSSLVMSFDWLELYNIILNMPEAELKTRGHGISPRYLWIPDRVGRLWMDNVEDSMDFSDSDSVSSVAAPAAPSESAAASEGGSHFGVSHGDISAAALFAEPGGVSQGDIEVNPPVAIDLASQGHVDVAPKGAGDDVSYESDFGAHSSPEEGVARGYVVPGDIDTPRAPRRAFEISRSPPDEPFRSSPLTVEAESSSSEVHRLPRTAAIGESFFSFDDSPPENSSDSAERHRPAPGSVESSGEAEVVCKEIGVQVHPMQVVITAKFVQRWASWP